MASRHPHETTGRPPPSIPPPRPPHHRSMRRERSPPRTAAGAPYATPADDPASTSSLAQPDPTSAASHSSQLLSIECRCDNRLNSPALREESGSHAGVFAAPRGPRWSGPERDRRRSQHVDPGRQRLAADPEILRDLVDRPATRTDQLDRLTTELLRVRGTTAWHGHHILPAGPDGPKRSGVHASGGTPPGRSPRPPRTRSRPSTPRRPRRSSQPRSPLDSAAVTKRRSMSSARPR